ncbi:hypothetical protein HDU67_001791 [Dinochytrium kinnereticum]|nr:hypothetical protein HDU67_001791 [Dinochytrium kinnereticum]
MIGVGFFQLITLATIFTANISSKSKQRQYILVAPLPFLTGALWFAVVRFMAPRAQYISKKDINSFDPSPTQSLFPSNNGEDVAAVLEDRALNPAFVKPLLKVWVWKRSQHLLPQLHTQRYANLDDYVRQHPEAASGVKEKNRRRIKLFANETIKRDRQQMKARAAIMAGAKEADEKSSAASSVADLPMHNASAEHLVGGDGSIEDELPPEEMAVEAGRGSEDVGRPFLAPPGVQGQRQQGGYGSPSSRSPPQDRRYQQNPADLQQQYRYQGGAYEMGEMRR